MHKLSPIADFYSGNRSKSLSVDYIEGAVNRALMRELEGELDPMITLNRGRATIYTFPPRGRFATANQPADKTSEASARIPNALSASGWYHEEAMHEAEANRRN